MIRLCTTDAHRDYTRRFAPMLKDDGQLHRKRWEIGWLAESVEGVRPGRAVGFGVGRDPVAAYLVAAGWQVLATDLPLSDPAASAWAGGGQHAASADALYVSTLLSRDRFDAGLQFRPFNMHHPFPPEWAGAFDLAWSLGVVDHLGSPKAAVDFVLRCDSLLRPGGRSVHTTEFASSGPALHFGHVITLQPDDLRRLSDDVDLTQDDTPADPPPYGGAVHMRMVHGGGTVLTSVGIRRRRPE